MRTERGLVRVNLQEWKVTVKMKRLETFGGDIGTILRRN
jgi:hypothetical protein